MHMSTHYQLLEPRPYIEDLITQIDSAERRVLLIALVIVDDAATEHLIAALERASKRGVQVSIGLDLYFTYREIENNTSRLSSVKTQLSKMRTMRRRLTKAGAEVRWLGMFGMTLFSRRTHIKWTVVDDIVYSFGGINLYSTAIDNNDYMMRVDSEKIAEHISAEHHRVIASDRAGVGYRSHAMQIADNTILIDGGKIGDSIIYRRALALTKQATRVVFVSQYCPTGRLGRALKHHPNATIYFNPWQNAHDPFNRALIRTSVFIHQMHTAYRRKKYLHAKLMLFTLPNGDEIALTGSHNFVAAGGMMGTREVALETKDPAIISLLKDFVARNIAT